MLTVVWLERLHVPPFAEALTRNPATTPNVVGFVSTGTTMGLGGVRPSISLGHLPGAIGVAETCTCTETNTTARRVSQGKVETGRDWRFVGENEVANCACSNGSLDPWARPEGLVCSKHPTGIIPEKWGTDAASRCGYLPRLSSPYLSSAPTSPPSNGGRSSTAR